MDMLVTSKNGWNKTVTSGSDNNEYFANSADKTLTSE